MQDKEIETVKKWVETWQRAGSALKEVKTRELRAYDHKKNQGLMDDLLKWACTHHSVRLSSGLVEQQQLFMKMRQHTHKISAAQSKKSQDESII